MENGHCEEESLNIAYLSFCISQLKNADIQFEGLSNEGIIELYNNLLWFEGAEPEGKSGVELVQQFKEQSQPINLTKYSEIAKINFNSINPLLSNPIENNFPLQASAITPRYDSPIYCNLKYSDLIPAEKVKRIFNYHLVLKKERQYYQKCSNNYLPNLIANPIRSTDNPEPGCKVSNESKNKETSNTTPSAKSTDEDPIPSTSDVDEPIEVSQRMEDTESYKNIDETVNTPQDIEPIYPLRQSPRKRCRPRPVELIKKSRRTTRKVNYDESSDLDESSETPKPGPSEVKQSKKKTSSSDTEESRKEGIQSMRLFCTKCYGFYARNAFNTFNHPCVKQYYKY